MKRLARVVATSLVAILGVFNLRIQFFYMDESERANRASAQLCWRGLPTLLVFPLAYP
jgi:hypothetical protein